MFAVNTTTANTANTANTSADASDNALGIISSSSKHFGKKTLSLASSIALTLNNDLGPGMILFPLIMQESGYLVLTAVLVTMFLVSTFCCTMLCEAIQRIPGNRGFTQRWEYTGLVEHFFGERFRVPAQILFNFSMQASNIAAMIIAAQVFDVFLVTVFGRSYAFDYVDGVMLTADDPHAVDLWGGETWIVSLGYVLTMVICIPFGYLNLEENMSFQWLSFVALVILVGEFFVQFVLNVDNHTRGASMDNVPMFTSLSGQVHVVGSVVFAYSYVVPIPSWLNEKRPEVSVNQALWLPGKQSV
jgi:amino acid permease